MTHQVLARKWRPRTFQQVVGQAPVVRALTNSLDQNRLHHAYLFTGTRGVGKTSIARLFAKCLNCQTSISAHPCDTCDNCKAIDEGRFLDLLEVDAASRTKVDDTRDLLDNVQYAPTQGRYKIYIIDEVHMLSTHSFNALLKTLEEPPPHVKFLLATTDPQRLPITVLSRCLQFHLKNLSSEQIAKQLAHILEAEKLNAEPAALMYLAHAAQGSMRDALSLMDQAIAYTQGALSLKEVKALLGATEPELLLSLLESLVAENAQQLLDDIHVLAESGVDFQHALEELLSLLHQITLEQAVPGISQASHYDVERMTALAKGCTAETVQLYYQIGLIGRRDLPLAPTPRSGFEMVILRMLAFSPAALSPLSKHFVAPSEPRPQGSVANIGNTTEESRQSNKQILDDPRPQGSVASDLNTQKKEIITKEAESTLLNLNTSATIKSDKVLFDSRDTNLISDTLTTLPCGRGSDGAHDSEGAIKTFSEQNTNWPTLLPQLQLQGATALVASHCTLTQQTPERIELALDPNFASLLNKTIEAQITQALKNHFQAPITVLINVAKSTQDTPAALDKKQQDQRQCQAVDALASDTNLQALMNEFGGKIIPNSIKST